MQGPPSIRQPWPKMRQHPRRPVEGRLHVITCGTHLRGWLHDVSEEGVGGIVAAQLAPDSDVVVEFELSTSIVRANAFVRFGHGFRYGFQFTTLPPEAREAIRQYCTAPENFQ